MKRLIAVVTLILIQSQLVSAQQIDESGIKAPINDLFLAMQKGDSSLARKCFTADAKLATVSKDKAGNPVLRSEESIEGFMKAVGTPHPQTWFEEIWNIKIQQDGDFANVWCDYAFYVDKTFSHCGVDSFHLYKTKDGWKIFQLADTRRKTDCKIPDEIQAKHK
jgi:hypothetical protein